MALDLSVVLGQSQRAVVKVRVAEPTVGVKTGDKHDGCSLVRDKKKEYVTRRKTTKYARTI